MAADVASVDWYAEDSVSPLTMTKPAASAVGDVLLAIVIQHNNPSAQTDLTTPTGWTFQSAFDGVLDDGKAWTRVIDGTEPSTWDWPYKSTADVVGAIVRITGAETTPTIVSASTPTTSVTSPIDSPSITPSGTNDLLISVLADICNGTQLVATVPSGMTSWGLGEVTGHFMSARLASLKLASGAATGVQTWTSVTPTGITGGTWTVAVKSAASTVSGSVTSTGAGGLSAAAVQRATVSPAGTGTVTAAATQIIRATATITGAGTLTASVVQRVAAAPAGAGALTALALQAARVSTAGAGVLAATVVQLATAGPAGAGSLAAAATVTGGAVNGTAALIGAGALTVVSRQGAVVAAAGTGQLAVLVTQLAGLSATGGGTLAALVRQGAGVSPAGTGQFTAAATVTVRAAAALIGAGLAIAAGTADTCDCLVHRPYTSTVARGSTGTVTRPNTGVVTRPCSC